MHTWLQQIDPIGAAVFGGTFLLCMTIAITWSLIARARRKSVSTELEALRAHINVLSPLVGNGVNRAISLKVDAEMAFYAGDYKTSRRFIKEATAHLEKQRDNARATLAP